MSWKKLSMSFAVLALLAGSMAWAGHHEAEYEALSQKWEAAYNSGDAAAVAALYAEDGSRMPPDVPIVTGREAVQAQIQGGMDLGMVKAKIETLVSHVSGDVGHARGEFTLMSADGGTMTQGKWASVAKYVDGEWQIQFDIWNYDAPFSPPE